MSRPRNQVFMRVWVQEVSIVRALTQVEPRAQQRRLQMELDRESYPIKSNDTFRFLRGIKQPPRKS